MQNVQQAPAQISGGYWMSVHQLLKKQKQGDRNDAGKVKKDREPETNQRGG